MKLRNPNVYIPDELEDVVSKALAKVPDERYATMAELEAALLAAVPEVPALAALPSLPPERPSMPRASKPEMERKLAPDTTMSEKRAPTAEVVLPTRKPWPMIALAAGALLALGIGAVVMLSEEEPPPRTEVAAPEPAPDEEPVAQQPEVEPGIDPPSVEPTRPTVALTSAPEGAEVRLDDRVLGTTPLTIPLPASDEAMRLTFAMEGYLDRTVTVIPEEGLEVPTVRLTRRRRAQTSSEGTSLPIKTGL